MPEAVAPQILAANAKHMRETGTAGGAAHMDDNDAQAQTLGQLKPKDREAGQHA